jgi:hypothetical protein
MNCHTRTPLHHCLIDARVDDKLDYILPHYVRPNIKQLYPKQLKTTNVLGMVLAITFNAFEQYLYTLELKLHHFPFVHV